jgi:hypothetical protein
VVPHATLTRQTHSEQFSSPRFWLWFNLLSLDAPAVAVLWQAFLARSLHADLRWPASVALAASVWLIYVADRLLDSLQPAGAAITPRHQFYRVHWWTVVPGAAAVVLLLTIACCRLNAQVLRNGMIMASLVGMYFFAVHAAPRRLRPRWPKELAVGILFTLGTCLATWTKLGASQSVVIPPAILFACLCALNCVAIEFWEWTRLGDMSSARPHVFTLWIGRHLKHLALFVAIASCALLAIPALRAFFVPTALSALAFWWLDQNSRRLSTDALRVLADVSLLTPLLLLGFGH